MVYVNKKRKITRMTGNIKAKPNNSVNWKNEQCEYALKKAYQKFKS